TARSVQPLPLAGGRDLDARARIGVPAAALADRGGVPALRSGPLSGLAGTGTVVQGRRTDLAAGASGSRTTQGICLRFEGVPPRRAQPRVPRTRPAPRGT